MTTTAIFRDNWKVDFLRNKFRRGSTIEIWDANLRHGDVRPFACPELACASAGDLQTLYPLPDCKCLGFTDVRPLVRGFCGEQHYHLDNGTLRNATEEELCSETPGCRAGAPTIPTPPSVASGCSGDCDSTGVSYVVTFVTEHSGIQTESAPTPASEIVASNGETPNASVSWGAAPAGYCIVATRLYRTETTFGDGTASVANEGAEFVLVAEFAGGGAGGFVDNVPSSNTGYPLTTYKPSAFPAPTGLVGLARTKDGLVVADRNRVYISLPGQAQFTFDGVVEIPDDIQWIAAIGNTVFVFTDNYPVKISFQHTQQSMSVDMQVVQRRLPLKSRQSVSVYGDEVFFSSTHSLYRWSLAGYGNDINSSLTQLVSPEQWKNMDPSSITGTAYEFGYIFSSDAIDYSLMVEFGEDRTDNPLVQTHIMPISYVNGDVFATGYDGNLVYQQDGNIYCWDTRRCPCGDFEIYDHVRDNACEKCDCCPWRLTLYIDGEGKNRFSKMRVEFDERTDSIDMSYYRWRFGKEDLVVDGVEIICSRGFSLPKFCSSQTFAIKMSSCAIMSEVRLGTSNQELVSNSNNQIET